ncbi:hypothetical protein F0562_008140 [Nyssa sinensis]|uniref:Uncharacterized protein n=1 Tax=Nyssa sinensis TaxID=561372 RepID=A0A5J5AB23_9ASTE|nr:hypothetical protein F0562_008140 [Nyssa sinensis]
MKRKNLGGGRARLSQLPPKPSAMALNFLGDQPPHFEASTDCFHNNIPVNEANNDSVHNLVPDSSDSDDNGPRHDLAPNTNGQRDFLPEKLGAKASSVNEGNDVVNRCGDNTRLGDHDQHKIVLEQLVHSKPIIACGSDGVCCREEETGHQFEILQAVKRVLAEHPKQVDDHEHERVVEDEQQAEPLSASPVEEDTMLDGALHTST